MGRAADMAAFLTALAVIFCWAESMAISAPPSFAIDYERNVFVKDGLAFRYISGSMHYARVLPEYWRDRLLKMRAAGLNTVQTYVPWNWHEPRPGTYRFDGRHDVVQFIKTAQDVGLLVILRPGPFIDGEWESGGFPGWLSKNTSLRFRTSDPAFMAPVSRWFEVFLPLIRPLLYQHGGPIITIQVENEYGNFGCNPAYLHQLTTIFRHHLGDDIILFSTDGARPELLRCGSIEELFSTIDFGVEMSAQQAFTLLRQVQPKGPLVNSEFYSGWLDYWGGQHHRVSADLLASHFDDILSENASVNMYMFEGGTAFGYMNGADLENGTYLPVPTSYDYNAPLDESGRYYTQKYDALQAVIQKHTQQVPPSPPVVTPAVALGFVQFEECVSLHDLVKSMFSSEKFRHSLLPLSFEELEQYYGFVVYNTSFRLDSPLPANSPLTIKGMLHDRTVVLLNWVVQGVLNRSDTTATLLLADPLPAGEVTMTLLVENQGRVDFGPYVGDSKGFTGDVFIGSDLVSGYPWTMYSIVESPQSELFHPIETSFSMPTFYKAKFRAENIADSFLRLDGFSKGQAFVNGFNLGRYWPVAGPQKTLYVPAAVLLSSDENTLVVFEVDFAPCKLWMLQSSCRALFTDTPDLGKI